MSAIKVAVLGATSYTGVELVRHLAAHPFVRISHVSSQSFAGQRLSDVFGELRGVCDSVLLSPEQAREQTRDIDCVFSCLPHAVSAGMLMPFIEQGVRVVDLSADFRLRDPETYTLWYKIDHPCPRFLKEAVYGLVEHYRDAIRTAQIVANPGCYVTSVLLPLIPLLRDSSVRISSIIADSKSGVSGAGRTLKLVSHFVEANENFSAYCLGRQHRHVPEMEQELSVAAGKSVTLTFTPHLVPINRGILSTLYLHTDATAKQCEEIVHRAYGNEPFVRIRPSSDVPKVRYVAGTNFCDMAFCGGGEGQPVIVVSVIDNLLKGASGQAIQNMNTMFGFDETAGLR